jgi:hypothetical protein
VTPAHEPDGDVPSVELYDTTLRDGAQQADLSYTVEDRMRILHKLDQVGFPFVEGGWPGANPRDTAATDPNDPGWHTGPARQFVITLSGNSEVEVSGGVHVLAGPGHINLIEDTTGKGHMTRNFGPEDRIALTIPLADGVVVEGVRKPRTK